MRATMLAAVLLALPACTGSDTGQQQRPTPDAQAPTTPAAAACSAAELPNELKAQPGLPNAVASTRQEIYQAAVSCDLDRLGELVAEEFTYSFGGGEDPVGFWRDAELRAETPAPMRHLAGLLQRPYGTRQVQGRTQYEWPSAFGYDAWSDVPEQDRQALEPLYDAEDFARFAQFGAYVGYRVILTEDGSWTAFVAGD